jgi:predicted AlkP superfamily phosphohydrolase/phosphomutase
MHPTLLIGLDGATFTILDALVADGVMPNLGRWYRQGSRAVLTSTAHPLTPPAWLTMTTGRHPGGHGVFDFVRPEVRGRGSHLRLNNFRDVQAETIWSMVSRAGGRIIALNFPLTAPPPAVSGAMVPGLVSWRHMRSNVQPQGLWDELKSLPGLDPKAISWDFEQENKALMVLPEEERVPWVEFHLHRERHWFRILEHLVTTRPADLTAVMFDGVDKLQHICWPLLDERYTPSSPSPAERRLRDLCRDYFRQMDGFLAAIVERAGPEARVLVGSDHGFGPSSRIFRANKWLQQQGYLRWAENPAARQLPGSNQSAAQSVALAFDWEHTLAYVPSSACNGIYINVRRSPDDHGLAPEEYAGFRARLIDQLRGLRDPETDRPLLSSVMTREEAFPGPYCELAPDLTLTLWDHGYISVLDLEPVISIRLPVTGTHYPEGILLARGPGIRADRMLPRQAIVDVTPTLLYSLGLPVPEGLDGRVMTELFEPDYLADNPIRTAESDGEPVPIPVGALTADADPDADERVLQQLRALGYIE